MSTTILCEICGDQARDRTPPGHDWVTISCPTCGNYSIAGSVRNKFRQLSPDERRKALQTAIAHASLLTGPLIAGHEL